MNEVLLNPPRTIMQVFKTLPEGTLAEVIDNVLYMSPAPNPFHQRIQKSLAFKLDEYIIKTDLGELFIAPVDLYLDETSNAVQPDILFIAANNPLSVDLNGLHGVPDFIIEILSPGNEVYDKGRKKELYQRFGVNEYWIVDPKSKQAIGYKLIAGIYVKIGEFQGKIESTLFKETFSF